MQSVPIYAAENTITVLLEESSEYWKNKYVSSLMADSEIEKLNVICVWQACTRKKSNNPWLQRQNYQSFLKTHSHYNQLGATMTRYQFERHLKVVSKFIFENGSITDEIRFVDTKTLKYIHSSDDECDKPQTHNLLNDKQGFVVQGYIRINFSKRYLIKDITRIIIKFYIMRSGSLFSFGDGRGGRLGVLNYLDDKHCPIPALCQGFESNNCAEISLFNRHTLAIDYQGRVYGHGFNHYGQLGLGHRLEVQVPALLKELSGYKVTNISVGSYHSVVTTDTNEVWSFGDNRMGQLGDGSIQSRNYPRQIPALRNQNIVHISCGDDNTCAISATGTLWTWGNNNNGEAGIGNHIGIITAPTKVEIDSDGDPLVASYCQCGDYHTLLITVEGKLLSFGRAYNYVLGNKPLKNQYRPSTVLRVRFIKIKDVGTGWNHSLAVSEDGKLWTWGNGRYGCLGHSNQNHQSVPKVVEYFVENDIVIVSCVGGSNHSAVISANGELFMFGRNFGGELGINDRKIEINSTPQKLEYFGDSIIQKVSLGGDCSAVIALK